jgi:tRNA threonylcarbamoyl adenosine modification protein YeaZ
MLLLAFDTAGPQCAVALARGDQDSFEILAGATERIVRGHAERLMPMIEAALDQSGLSFGDIDRIAVTIGPGSFTGVRVGVAAGRGLGLALGIPVLGIGTLHALAAMAVESHRYGRLWLCSRPGARRSTRSSRTSRRVVSFKAQR